MGVFMAEKISTPDITPILYSQIGFRADLETEALRKLDDADFDGCRMSLGFLLNSLSGQRDPACADEAAQLLLDVLHRVNWQLHRAPNDGSTYQANRVMLIDQFGAQKTPEHAYSLFLPLLNRLLASARAENSVHHPLIERAKRFIDGNYNRRIVLSTVAGALNISPNYLSRVFRKETGCTLTAYTQTVRMAHARGLLANGVHSISEIAYLVGYQNYRDFHRNFVKHEHASPREVRTQLRVKQPTTRLTSNLKVAINDRRPAH